MGKPEVLKPDQPFEIGTIFESGYGMRVDYHMHATPRGIGLGAINLASDDLVARLAQLEPPVTADRGQIIFESMTRPTSSVMLSPGELAVSVITLFYPHPGPTNKIDTPEL